MINDYVMKTKADYLTIEQNPHYYNRINYLLFSYKFSYVQGKPQNNTDNKMWLPHIMFHKTSNAKPLFYFYYHFHYYYQLSLLLQDKRTKNP